MRRARIAIVALVAALALAACEPIVVDEEGVVSSEATRQVAPATLRIEGRDVAAVEISMHSCHTLRYVGSDPPQENHLRPFARVADRLGATIFANLSMPFVIPPGARVVDRGDGGDHQIVVPVEGARLPLRITSGCTAYPGFGSGLAPVWTFPFCQTATGICKKTFPGEGTYQPGGV